MTVYIIIAIDMMDRYLMDSMLVFKYEQDAIKYAKNFKKYELFIKSIKDYTSV